MKCEYCGEKIGLLAVRYTWIDKAKGRAMHDKCYEQYLKKIPAQNQKEVKSMKMTKSRILGAVLLVLSIAFTILLVWAVISISELLGVAPTINFISPLWLVMLVLGYISGIELIRIKKDSLYHKLILIIGIVLIVLYLFAIIPTIYVYMTGMLA